MGEEIKFDHFKDINDLLKNIDSWYKEDDIEYTRWFGLTDLYNLKIYITSLQQKVEQQENEIDRLNNIIEELEKWCNECIDNHIIARENGYTTISDTFFEIVLDKIKELKEDK